MSEREDILAAIRDAGTISKAARRLGVARRTLQKRMRFHGIPEGKRGRTKRPMSYSRKTRGYATVAAAVAVVAGGALLLRKRGSTTA